MDGSQLPEVGRGALASLRNLFFINRNLAALNRQAADAQRVSVQMFHAMVSLAKVSIRDKEQLVAFMVEMISKFGKMMEGSIDREEKLGNPLNPDEVQRLRYYYGVAQAGSQLTYEQAQDFDYLARRLEEDRTAKGETDWGAIILAGLAAVILAALLAELAKKK